MKCDCDEIEDEERWHWGFETKMIRDWSEMDLRQDWGWALVLDKD